MTPTLRNRIHRRFNAAAHPHGIDDTGAVMIFVATILTIAAGVFYGASVNNGIWADQVCRYGMMFCSQPAWLGVPALLSIIWALVLRVDRL